MIKIRLFLINFCYKTLIWRGSSVIENSPLNFTFNSKRELVNYEKYNDFFIRFFYKIWKWEKAICKLHLQVFLIVS